MLPLEICGLMIRSLYLYLGSGLSADFVMRPVRETKAALRNCSSQSPQLMAEE